MLAVVETIQAGEAANEGDEHGDVDEDELANILKHPAVGYLQLTEHLTGR